MQFFPQGSKRAAGASALLLPVPVPARGSTIRNCPEWLRVFALLLLLSVGVQAQAQTFTVSPLSPSTISLGTQATPASGTVLVTTTPAAGSLVTITCTGTGNSCGNKSGSAPSASIVIQAGSISGRTDLLKNFTVTAGTNSSIVGSTTGSGTSHSFTLNTTNFGSGHTRSFRVGAGFTVTRVGDIGTATAIYSVSATPGTSSPTGTYTATVSQRPFGIAKGNNLVFGSVAKPTGAAKTVTVSPNAGSTNRGTFILTGDYKRTFSISLNANSTSITMTGPPGGALNLVPSLSEATGSLTSNDPAVSDGTWTVGVGGTITVTKDTVPGTYQGTIFVTAQYN